MSKDSYTIHKDTYALISTKHTEYRTTVIEHEGTNMQQETPFEIIKESCLAYYSDYEGHRNAVIKHLRYTQKTPIPISISQKLCFFPTHSPTHIENSWINFSKIRSWRALPLHERQENEQIEVTFKNRKRITLDVSKHTFRNQHMRAFMVMNDSLMISQGSRVMQL